MSNFIKGVKVGKETKKIDYESLGNLPDLESIKELVNTNVNDIAKINAVIEKLTDAIVALGGTV